MNKAITLLGSTGSIGTQCLDVCEKQNFRVRALVANSNLELLEEQARKFCPEVVATANENLLSDLKLRLNDLPTKVVAGSAAIEELAAQPTDIVVNSITGIAGLKATLSALDSGNNLALANKEALVTGGQLVMNAAKSSGAQLLPIDSEHSAIWQSLRSGERNQLKKIILTASGGPFFGRSSENLSNISVKEALAHPNWTMGSKISIDSATLMNKGLEFIEAIWLFDLKPEQIEIVIHRQSVVHSAVEFVDGSVIAQMGVPDMRVAIQYALTYPDRLPLETKIFSLTDYASLTFQKPDYKTFICLKGCIDAAKLGGLAPCLVNGVNEKAVELFLEEKVPFLRIGELVCSALEEIKLPQKVTLDSILETDQLAREYVLSKVF